MTAMTDRARDAAVRDYSHAYRTHIAEAKRDERRGRPIHAAKERAAAVICHRAALNEEMDDEPRGLGELK